MNIHYEKPNYVELLNVFIGYKRLAGFKYLEAEKSLRRFVKFLSENADSFTKETVDTYIDRQPNETSKTQSNRVGSIRQFAIYLYERGYDVYIPRCVGRKGWGNQNFTPYIFSHDEIQRIFTAVDLIKPHSRYNCEVVYPVLFRVLYCCGLRISEALGLRIKDVDLENGILRIRSGKYGNDRLVPMSETLKSYCLTLSEHIHINAIEEDYFFKNPDGSARGAGIVYQRFRRLLWESNIPYMGKGKGPRLHDLRHTFSCHTLKNLSDVGIDLYCALPILSTYLGHKSIKATEGYLRLTAEFHPDVLARMSKISSFVFPEVYAYEAN